MVGVFLIFASGVNRQPIAALAHFALLNATQKSPNPPIMLTHYVASNLQLFDNYLNKCGILYRIYLDMEMVGVEPTSKSVSEKLSPSAAACF